MRTVQMFELRAPVKNPGKKSIKDPLGWGDKTWPAGMLVSVVSGASGSVLLSVGRGGLRTDDPRAKAILDAAGPPTKPIGLGTLFELHGFGADVVDEAHAWLRGHYPRETDWLVGAMQSFAQQKLAGLPDQPADPVATT